MKLVILDLDGTLFRGSVPISGAAGTVQALLNRALAVRYLTNNSTAPPHAVAAKLTSMGFNAPIEWIATSSMGAAWRLEGNCRRALVLGEAGLVSALESVGIEVELATHEVEPTGFDAVVVGLCRAATYEAIARCQSAILGGARFVATNRDATYPIENGGLIPGAGSLIAAVTTASMREPEVIGKPEPFLVERLMEEVGASPAETLVVGDRIDTDIEAGRRAGTRTLLVLSGVTHSAPEGYADPVEADVRGVLDLIERLG